MHRFVVATDRGGVRIINITKDTHTLEVDHRSYLKDKDINQLAIAGEIILAVDSNAE